MGLIGTIDAVDDCIVESRLIEQFVAVADEGNVTRAAARLYAAQSTVSAGIRSLERELGGRLFDRDSRHVVLTALGEALLPEARTALAALDRMRDLATSSDAELRGRVRLGIFSSMDIVDLTTVLRDFRARHPLVDVQLQTSPTGTSGLVSDVRAGRLDLAFTGGPRPTADLEVLPIREYPFRLFVAAEHRLATRKTPVSLAELVDEPFVETARGFANRMILDGVLESLRLRRRIVAEMNEMPAVIRFAGAGLGVAVCPDFDSEGRAVALDLVEDIPPLRIGLAVRSGTEPNRATRTLAGDIVRAARQHN
jgi:DNA-binding transcriptional LysR family regulator